MSDAVRKTLEPFLRVQDREGRGPFRPGMPDRWRDPDGRDFPPVQIEFGLAWRSEIPPGWHCGCAFRTAEQARQWFSPWECDRLHTLGYRLVQIKARPLRESGHQSIVVRPQPFRWGAVAMPWPRQPASLAPWRDSRLRRSRREGGCP